MERNSLMNFTELLLFILSSFGITTILTKSYILSSIRPKYKFFHCNMCMGFWVGVILTVFNQYTTLFNFDLNLLNLIIMSSLVSGTSYFLGTLIDDEGLRISK